MARDDERNYMARCSFCGKSESMVHKLIEGPGVFICDECINLCNDLIEKSVPSARTTTHKSEDDLVLPKPEEIKNKLDEYGCNGAPDWIIEIVSPSSQRMDYGIKLFKYRTAGVREYWIVNPVTRVSNVFDFEHDKNSMQYSFDDKIPVCIYEDLCICISDLL